ncbi:histone deacetylase family protein [Citreimonas salinaria]|uniref:Acetoin utilization deacetylase AcuC n=1 Tax=Citreimonas salinaria TaxID=321339 RepID=A0A1H3NXJ3_9RHOB|nr:histone deacetylase [Citreimonas salinaria]SDY93255.1 Acetoin utilization deacetylase AcuC [Citreimonas salinaria]
MANRRALALFDERMLLHRPQVEDPFQPGRLERRVREILNGLEVKWNFPERPERLVAIRDLLDAEPIAGLVRGTGRSASREQLARVHTFGYLDSIDRWRGRSAWLDVDTTAVSPGSVEAAEIAAGTAIAAVEAVASGSTDSAFALVRPPGHHAESVRARGSCLFNNVAVAAAHAQAELNFPRILIVDWDAHHGNGTQEIFWASPDVLFFDIHRAAPFYPGSGLLGDVGAGLGEGTTVNVPIPAGAGDAAFLKAMREVLRPAADWFKPDLVLVSAGFDAHQADFALNVSHEGFAAMTGIVQEIADRHCEGRLVLVLEGGYQLEALSRSVHTVLRVLTGETPAEVREPGLAEVEDAAAFHLPAFSDDA